MVFEVQGKTDQFLQLKKDDRGIQFLGRGLALMTSQSNNAVYPYLQVVDHSAKILACGHQNYALEHFRSN